MSKIVSPGKLMLTSEYFAIDGALVLAVPTQLGQEFFFEEVVNDQSTIVWEAFHQNKLWLRAVINYHTWAITETNIPDAAAFILNVLRNVQSLSTHIFQSNSSYYLKTNLQFPANYGLGSSSTLMTNLAQWARIDPFTLNDMSLGGSGYDIAVAEAKSAVLYQNKPDRIVQPLIYEPAFKEELLFIHLNQKQDSREGIRLYKSKEKSELLISEFSALTRAVVDAQDLEKFSELMVIHESKLSNFLGIATAKEKYFNNCPSFIKSLGAWGGDFVMASKFEGYHDWFSQRGFQTIFSWSEIID